MAATSLSEKKFRNTFEPRCRNKYLTVGQLIRGLRLGAWDIPNLPKDAQAAVRQRLREMHSK